MYIPRLKPDAMGEPRNPLQVYLLCLCILSGLSTMGATSEGTSGSIDSLEHHSRVLWGTMIASGGFMALLGMYWQGDARTALILKRLGFMTLVIPCIIFSIVVVSVAGWGGATVAATLLGFAVACYLRARDAHRLIRRIIRRTVDDHEH